MWAELLITVKQDLGAQLVNSLGVNFGQSLDARSALELTVWRDNITDAMENQVVYAKSERNRVFLVFKDDIQTIRVHVAIVDGQQKLARLKRDIQEIGDKFENFLKQRNNQVTSLKITIWAENDDFQIGEKLSYVRRLWALTKSNIETKVYVPVVTVIATWVYPGDEEHVLKKVFVNFVFSLVGVLLWILVVAIKDNPYVYEDS